MQPEMTKQNDSMGQRVAQLARSVRTKSKNAPSPVQLVAGRLPDT